MKPLRARIAAEADKAKVPQPVIEKDYALSYILAGLAAQTSLSESLVFKGGTALKKLFFGDYRFSEDLDYSAIKAPKGKELLAAMESAGQTARRLLLEQGPFEVAVRRYEERNPHPHGQEAFTFHIQFPWHPSPLCRIKVEVSQDELVILPPITRDLIHGYEEPLAVKVSCYPLTEIVAEKLRTLLQTHEKLTTRGWNRPRARDYYDLWRLLREFRKAIDKQKLLPLLKQKCQHRNIGYSGIDDFFTDELIAEARTHWQGTLGAFVAGLPPLDEVLKDLRRELPKLITME